MQALFSYFLYNCLSQYYMLNQQGGVGMPHNIRIVSSYPPRKCGVGTFSRDLASALENFTGEVGHIRVAAIDKNNGPYSIPVDLVIDQYNSESWGLGIKNIITKAKENTNPTIVVLQHEYGFDPDKNGEDSKGKMERIAKERIL
jgi:hypothetical protein